MYRKLVLILIALLVGIPLVSAGGVLYFNQTYGEWPVFPVPTTNTTGCSTHGGIKYLSWTSQCGYGDNSSTGIFRDDGWSWMPWDLTIYPTGYNFGCSVPEYLVYRQPVCYDTTVTRDQAWQWTSNPALLYGHYSDVTFSLSDSTNFATKLSGAVVTISNGQTNTTNSAGEAYISIYPNSSAYTYSLIKTGYTTKSAQPLGGYGMTGGILYDTMVPGYTGGNKLVNLLAQDATSGAYINGFTGNVKDTVISRWTNGTYPSGVGEIWTNQSTALIAYLSATGYTSTTSTKTTRADKWAEDWVVPMYKTTDIPANASWSKLRISVTYKDTGQPATNVFVSNGYDGTGKLTPGSGVVIFDVPNNSAVGVQASKSGYQTAVGTFTTTTALSDWAMQMVLAAAPTPTPMPTWANGAPKYDSAGNLLDQNGNIIGAPAVTPTLTGSALDAYNQQQGRNTVQILYDNGPALVQLCVLVIFMSLIYMLMPKR
jgi:hypothetical protein